MSILKTKKCFTYVVVGALVIALSISCKTDDVPTETGSTTQSHPSQGSYVNSPNNTRATVIVNNDGTCRITGTARYESEYQDFDITITKWYYSFSSYNTYHAGSLYEESEATINSPSGEFFQVDYNVDNNGLWISFGPEGKKYITYALEKQQ